MPVPADRLVALIRRTAATHCADADLLRAYADNHDGTAFRQLVARHGPLVLGVCRRALGDAHAADDAFQATFLALARRPGAVRRPAALAAWLFGTARRICAKVCRADARRRAAEARAPVRPPAADPGAELSARELLAALDDEVARLSEGERLPLLLVYWQGLPQPEAARRLGLTLPALRGRLDRGRKRLADRLTRRGFGPTAVLAAPLTTAAVPRELLAATAALAADPWSKALPAAVLALTAGGASVKLWVVVALGVALAGAGAWRAGSVSDRSEALPPVAHAPGSPAQPQPDTPRADRYGDPLPPGAIARLGTLRYRIYGVITHLSVRPDGRVAFWEGGAIDFMDVQTGQIVKQFGQWTHTANVRTWGTTPSCFAFAPDGRTFAVGVRYPTGAEPPTMLRLCDASTGATLREVPGPNELVPAMTFLVGGQQLATLGASGVIHIWDVTTGARLHELKGPDRKLTRLAASSDGRTLAAGAEVHEGTAAIYLWDAATGKLRHTLAGHTAGVQAIAFAPDGRTLASGGDAAVRLWDVATGRELRQLTGHAKEAAIKSPDSVHSLAFSPDGRTIASASTDWTVRVWSVDTGQPLVDFAGPGDESDTLAFLDDRTLLVGGRNILLLRDVTTHSFKNSDASVRDHITFAGYAPDGRTIVTAERSGVTHTWNAADGRHLSSKLWGPLTTFTRISDNGRLVAFTERKDGEVIACIGDVATGQVVRRLPEGERRGIVFSPDGRWLTTGLVREPTSPDEPTLGVWDTSTGAKLGQFPAIEPSLYATVFSPDGRWLFTSEGRDPPYRLRQWDVASGRPVKEFALPKDSRPGLLAVSPGGRRLAGIDGVAIRLWDVMTGQECWQVNSDLLGWMTFSPDGTLLAVAGTELRDTRTGQLVATVPGRELAVAFSPDSRRLVSGSESGTALVWDVEAVTGRRLGGPLDDARQAALWDDLAGDAAHGVHAIECWQAAPQAAAPFLRRQIKPAVAVPVERVRPLIAALDSPTFATREQATKELRALGPAAEPPLRAALATAILETRRRIETILGTWDAEQTRAGRAVEVLEAIATPEARALLEELAKGDPAARLTREAQASLDRLTRRTGTGAPPK